MTTKPGIFRSKLDYENQFTQIYNAWIRDSSISYRAKGLLTYFLSHEIGYTITIGQIVRESNDGRDSVRAAIEELIKGGYLETQRTTDERGYNAGLAYYIKNPESENPKLENPKLENPKLENPTALEDNLIKNTNKEENTNTRFEEFWNHYPKKLNKTEAKQAFLKAIKKTKPETIIEGVIAYSKKRDLPEQQFIPYPATWLNKARWENETDTQPKTSWKLGKIE